MAYRNHFRRDEDANPNAGEERRSAVMMPALVDGPVRSGHHRDRA